LPDDHSALPSTFRFHPRFWAPSPVPKDTLHLAESFHHGYEEEDSPPPGVWVSMSTKARVCPWGPDRRSAATLTPTPHPLSLQHCKVGHTPASEPGSPHHPCMFPGCWAGSKWRRISPFHGISSVTEHTPTVPAHCSYILPTPAPVLRLGSA
jgi:hypothetical protein